MKNETHTRLIEFDSKVFGGQKTPEEKKAILQADFAILNSKLRTTNLLVIEKYIVCKLNEVKSVKALIQDLRENKALLTTFGTTEEINEIFKQCTNETTIIQI